MTKPLSVEVESSKPSLQQVGGDSVGDIETMAAQFHQGRQNKIKRAKVKNNTHLWASEQAQDSIQSTHLP